MSSKLLYCEEATATFSHTQAQAHTILSSVHQKSFSYGLELAARHTAGWFEWDK